MPDTAKPFAFTQLVPGFDFLRSLTGSNAKGGVLPGLPSLASWVAPTLNVEELEKRIDELKTVQFWLEQNVHALKATIQALEVQKMTLSTLRGMNVHMGDLAKALTGSGPAAAAPLQAKASAPVPPPASAAANATPDQPAPATHAAPATKTTAKTAAKAAAQPPASTPPSDPAAAAQPGIVDPTQWWGALTEQFQEIAGAALKDAARMSLPKTRSAARPAKSGRQPAAGRATPASTKTAAAKRKVVPRTNRPQ